MTRKMFSVLVGVMLIFTSLSCQFLSGPTNLPASPTATVVAAEDTIAPKPTATADTSAATEAALKSAQATEEAISQAATQDAADQATKEAEQALAGTETVVAQVTAQADDMYQAIKKLESDGVLTSSDGQYYPLADFKENLAKINYYRPFLTGHKPSDFVIRAHTSWESASKVANWFNSGCGFVFRYKDGDNHYMIYLALDSNVYMSGYVDGKAREFGKGSAGKIDHLKGSADIILVAQGDHFVYYVNGNKVFDKNNSELTEGDLAFTLVSGTNKDFGTRCEMTNVELWELNH